MSENQAKTGENGLFSGGNSPETPLFPPISKNKTKDKKKRGEKRDFADLDSIGLDEELAGLYNFARNLLEDIQDDSETPVNQKAQLLNSTTNLLERIAKLRTDVYNATRIMRLEQTLIRTLQQFPEKLRTEFLEAYERALKATDA